MATETPKVELELILKRRHPNGKGLSFWSREYGQGEVAHWINLPAAEVDMDENANAGDIVTVLVPEWLANKEGLI